MSRSSYSHNYNNKVEVHMTNQVVTWPRSYKTVFVLIVGVFIMLINDKMPTIVGILTFMSRINFVLS